jgi:hypothetical protein
VVERLCGEVGGVHSASITRGSPRQQTPGAVMSREG